MILIYKLLAKKKLILYKQLTKIISQTKMKNVKEQKLKLEQKKNRLAAEEIKLKLKERKARTRHLIELGGLIVKANLDHLPTNALYGALLWLQTSLEQDNKIQNTWTKLGKEKLGSEKQERTAVIVKFKDEPDKSIRDVLRDHTLKFNRFRQEWYGFTTNLEALKTALKDSRHNLEII